MTEMIVTTIGLSVLGIALRMWFLYAGARAMQSIGRASRGEDYGMSFDEKVARRLAELPQEDASRER